MDASSWAVFQSWLRATVGSAKNPKINQQTVNELACILNAGLLLRLQHLSLRDSNFDTTVKKAVRFS